MTLLRKQNKTKQKNEPQTEIKYLHITYQVKDLYPEYIQDSQNLIIRQKHNEKKWTKYLKTSPKNIYGWQKAQVGMPNNISH